MVQIRIQRITRIALRIEHRNRQQPVHREVEIDRRNRLTAPQEAEPPLMYHGLFYIPRAI